MAHLLMLYDSIYPIIGISSRGDRVWKTVRDILIVLVALLLGVYEVRFGGGRPPVLTFIASLLLSPVVMRVDDSIRQRIGKKNESSSPD
jgi:hypothetical protein